eukprot:TRINITY_DN33376_c0_g1_i1.p1 TRINITY_DN33376_c0_g1~~TRINITY_DN33376_c0_g1_i1.p1  ORF type:complete len:204 (+),score=38.77 TRINITY_DN33376_c0_g1_i1:88-612(+)
MNLLTNLLLAMMLLVGVVGLWHATVYLYYFYIPMEETVGQPWDGKMLWRTVDGELAIMAHSQERAETCDVSVPRWFLGAGVLELCISALLGVFFCKAGTIAPAFRTRSYMSISTTGYAMWYIYGTALYYSTMQDAPCSHFRVHAVLFFQITQIFILAFISHTIAWNIRRRCVAR